MSNACVVDNLLVQYVVPYATTADWTAAPQACNEQSLRPRPKSAFPQRHLASGVVPVHPRDGARASMLPMHFCYEKKGQFEALRLTDGSKLTPQAGTEEMS